MTGTQSILFTPVRIGTVSVPNRFARSATHDFMAEDDGSVTDRQVALFRRLAEGEVGLIIAGHAYVSSAGKAGPRQSAVDDDRLVEGLSRIPREVHQFPSRVFLQISHSGRQTKEKICKCTPLAPSAVYEPVFKVMPRAMTSDEVRNAVGDFIRAGHRAQLAGFDGVQLQVAHGYLLSSFISPYTNRRNDEWGGNIEGRTRIVTEIVRGIKQAEGSEFPVIVKLNSSDFFSGGLDLEESFQVARILATSGIDGIEASGGMSEAGKGSMWPGLRTEDEEGYFMAGAARLKAALRVPTFGLGGLRTFKVMENVVRERRADLISLSRPLIRDPGLVRRFRLGEIQKSDCISCNKCLNPRGIECAELKKSK
jgi:2,4-dienoyl-CoA reductase-like NADH-dependent reductase (Old Yellow Enzyme family)